MSANSKKEKGPFDFISDFFEEVVRVISEFLQSVFNFFSGDSGESSNKKNTETRREGLKEGMKEEESPAEKYKISPKDLLSQFEATSQSLESSQTVEQGESVINESSFSERISKEEVTRVHYEIFTQHNERYINIDDFINRFAGGVINKNHGEWLPNELRKFHQNHESSSAKTNPKTAPKSSTPILSSFRERKQF